MIKKCKVVLHNSAVAIADFDGINIQFPATKTDGDVVYVEHSDNRYIIVSKEDYEKSLKPKTDKKQRKIKATEIDLVEEVVETETVVDEADKTSNCLYCS